MITERFSEIAAIAQALPDSTVIDGEIVIGQAEHPQPFALLQQRIGRKRIDATLLNEAPVLLMAYDLLEWRGEDWGFFFD